MAKFFRTILAIITLPFYLSGALLVGLIYGLWEAVEITIQIFYSILRN